MTTVQFQAVEIPGKGWSLRIPEVVDRLSIDGRNLWRDRRNAETAAKLWLGEVKEAVRDLRSRGATNTLVSSEICDGYNFTMEQTYVLLAACNWFADDEGEGEVPETEDDAEPGADVYGGGDDARFVALTAAGGSEQWVRPDQVVNLWMDPERFTVIETDDATVYVNAPIAEVAAALGLRARDRRGVGAPVGEREEEEAGPGQHGLGIA
jgi:hypothetical protein